MCSSAGTNGKFNYNLISFASSEEQILQWLSTCFSIFWLSADFERQEYVLVMHFVQKFLWGFKEKWNFSWPGKLFLIWSSGQTPRLFLQEDAFLCLAILAHILTCEPLYQYNNRDTTRALLMVHTFSLAMIRYLQIERKKIILLLESIRKCLESSHSKVCCAASRALFRGTFILHRPKPKKVPTNVSIICSLEPSRHVIL